MKLHTSNSITDEVGIVYIAEDLTEGEASPEEMADTDVRKLSRDDAVQLVGGVRRRLGLGDVHPISWGVDPALVGGGADLAELPVGLGLRGGHVVRNTREAGVEFCAAEIVWLAPARRIPRAAPARDAAVPDRP